MKILKLILVKIADLNFLRMAEKSLVYVTENESLWKTDSKFSGTVGRISHIIAELNSSAPQQTEGLEGSPLKKNARKELAATASRIARQARVYAMEINDAFMKQNLNITSQQIMEMPEDEVVPRLTLLVETLVPVLDSLTFYGISQENLDDLSNGLISYAAANSTEIISTAKATASSSEIKILIQKLRGELKHLEKLAMVFDNPSFSSNLKNRYRLIGSDSE